MREGVVIVVIVVVDLANEKYPVEKSSRAFEQNSIKKKSSDFLSETYLPWIQII